MSLLYADLPPKPDPPPHRGRIELAIAGALAAAGVAAAGSGIAGDLLRRFVRPASDHASAPEAAATPPGFTGLERVVGAPVVVPPALAPATEAEFAPPAPGESALAEIEPEPDPPALPATAAPPRDVALASSRPGPEPTPSTGVPTTTVPPTTVPPTSTTTPSTSTTAPSSSTTSTSTTTTTLPPADPFPGPGSPVWILAVGAGYDVTPAAATTIAERGFDGWVDQQLAPTEVPDPAVEELLADFELLDRPVADLEAEGLVDVALSEARWADFARDAFSERQIEAQMATLWRSWFALPAGDVAAQLELDQIVRAGAVGEYAALAAAVARSDGLRRAHGIAGWSLDAVVDTTLAQRVLVDWVVGADEPVDDADAIALAEALVAGPAETESHLRGRLQEPAAIAHVGRAIGAVIGGAGSAAIDAAIAGFGPAGRIGDAVRAALLEGGVIPDRPATPETWLVRSLRRTRATVTIGGPWNPDDEASIPGLLRLLGTRPDDRVRSDDDERTPAAIAARWDVARSVVAGGTGIDVDLTAALPQTPLPATSFVDHLEAVIDLDLSDAERQAVLDYLEVDADSDVEVGPEPFADLCALTLSFPTSLARGAAA